MRATILKEISEAVSAYEEKPRDQWIFDYPAQVALTGTQMWWTSEVNIAFNRLEEGYENALKDYNKKQVSRSKIYLNCHSNKNVLLTFPWRLCWWSQHGWIFFFTNFIHHHVHIGLTRFNGTLQYVGYKCRHFVPPCMLFFARVSRSLVQTNFHWRCSMVVSWNGQVNFLWNGIVRSIIFAWLASVYLVIVEYGNRIISTCYVCSPVFTIVKWMLL